MLICIDRATAPHQKATEDLQAGNAVLKAVSNSKHRGPGHTRSLALRARCIGLVVRRYTLPRRFLAHGQRLFLMMRNPKTSSSWQRFSSGGNSFSTRTAPGDTKRPARSLSAAGGVCV